MHSSARFLFLGELSDLPSIPREWVTYAFKAAPSVKDAMEALGAPHTEVAGILVHGRPVDFSYLLQADDQVEVCPHQHPALENAASIVPSFSSPPRFVLDVHLGALARRLRLLGFDCLYRNDYSDRQIADLAAAEARIVLTRDVGLLKHKKIIWGRWLRAQQPEAQAREVISRFALSNQFRPFTRCLVCNGLLQPVDKAVVQPLLPPGTARCFEEFYQCHQCQKVYWKGTHYDRMQQWIWEIRKDM